MHSMFLNALEEAFDAYYKKNHPDTNLSDPHTLFHYKEELDKFAQFLIEEYEQSTHISAYWENRSK